ncbi:MAG: DUF4846 domain-containing protein [Bacteroidales bacterium]
MYHTPFIPISLLSISIFFICCNAKIAEVDRQNKPATTIDLFFVDSCQGMTVRDRIAVPSGFERKEYDDHSFQQYILTLPLKPCESSVVSYSGDTMHYPDEIVGVYDIALTKEDILQCADMLMKIRAEYLYAEKRYDEIIFTITNGMVVPFSKFAAGYRVKVSGGNQTQWVCSGEKGFTREVFDSYLTFIYYYAGTLSLNKTSIPVDINEIEIGDFFIIGGSPGHCMMMVDKAYNKETKETAILLGQGYMPSQDFHLLYPTEDFANKWFIIHEQDSSFYIYGYVFDTIKRFAH